MEYQLKTIVDDLSELTKFKLCNNALILQSIIRSFFLAKCIVWNHLRAEFLIVISVANSFNIQYEEKSFIVKNLIEKMKSVPHFIFHNKVFEM